MIYAAVFLLMILFLLDRLHCLRVSTTVFRYQCRLFEVRDHLREGVTGGQVNPSHWVFQYLDSTLVKTIDSLDRLTLWRVVSIALSSSEPGARKALKALDAELSKAGNEYVRKAYSMYQGLLVLYLIDRHPVLGFLGRCVFHIANFGLYVQAKFQQAANITASAHETSTLAEFAPA